MPMCIFESLDFVDQYLWLKFPPVIWDFWALIIKVPYRPSRKMWFCGVDICSEGFSIQFGDVIFLHNMIIVAQSVKNF